MLGKLKRLSAYRAGRRRLRPDVQVEHEVLGSEYGGWPVAVSGVGAQTTVYSFGAGYDISFDLAAIERFGCTVLVFDPTPRSVAWMTGQTLPDRLIFHPVGIDHADGQVEFHAPANTDHVSFAINRTASGGSQFSVAAPVLRLETIIAELAPAPPDIVKLDIEGFEYRVIADILSGPLRPSQLLVEFHHGKYGFDMNDTAKSVAGLRDAGYSIFHVSASGREYGFIRP